MSYEYEEPSFVTATGDKPLNQFKRLVANLQVQSLDLVGAAKYLEARTVSQALSGFTPQNTPFAPYSPSYAKQKRQGNVDLYGRREHEHMLDAVQAQVQVSPPMINLGIFDNPEIALRAAVNDQGLTMSGGRAKKYIKSLKRSHQKKSGLKRQLANRGYIITIPRRHFLEVTPQDVLIMSELIVESIGRRLGG